jgi:hypothetical protein
LASSDIDLSFVDSLFGSKLMFRYYGKADLRPPEFIFMGALAMCYFYCMFEANALLSRRVLFRPYFAWALLGREE